MKKLIIIISFCLIFTSLSVAKDHKLPELKTQIKTIIVFKNGLGFFIREGETELQDNWAVTETVPKATLGTFWLGTLHEGSYLEEAIAYTEKLEKQSDAISIDELLAANIGKKITITAFNNDIIEGTIKSIPKSRHLPSSPPTHNHNAPMPPLQSALIILETKDGVVAFHKNQIKKIEFSHDYSSEITVTEEAKRIKFKLGGNANNARLSLSYLQKGISWMPSYRVNIYEDDTARITMKSTLINDVEDLEDTDISFVVGYPNFQFSDVLSPMALGQNLNQFISALQRGRNEFIGHSPMSNVMRQSVSFAAEMRRDELDYNYSSIEDWSGMPEEDLFFYEKKGVSLNKGERAYYHIFSEEVDCEHIYEWRVPNTTEVDARGYQSSRNEETPEQVWHSLKLTNSTHQPWTTAPAFAIKAGKPISQDIINYTPKGATTNLKLTVATDIKTNRQEQEVERQRDIKLYRYSYDLVTVEGKLFVKNHKNKNVTMEITKMLTGEVLEASHSPEITKIAAGIKFKGVNNESEITWNFPLKSGEEMELTYNYQVYVAH